MFELKQLPTSNILHDRWTDGIWLQILRGNILTHRWRLWSWFYEQPGLSPGNGAACLCGLKVNWIESELVPNQTSEPPPHRRRLCQHSQHWFDDRKRYQSYVTVRLLEQSSRWVCWYNYSYSWKHSQQVFRNQCLILKAHNNFWK